MSGTMLTANAMAVSGPNRPQHTLYRAAFLKPILDCRGELKGQGQVGPEGVLSSSSVRRAESPFTRQVL